MEYLYDLLYLVPLLLIAGILDGIAGGGGIIALPAYFLTGMPPHSAYACNKIQSALGTSTSCAKFIKDKYIDFKTALVALPCTVGASFLATRLVMSIDGSVIKIIICCLLPVTAVLMFLKRKVSAGLVKSRELDGRTVLLTMLTGVVIGAYDGLFGPGGGTIAMMMFTLLLGYDLRVGNGNGKLIVVISNVTAVINYVIGGYMIWHVAIPCAIANMVGSYIGAAIGIKKGEKVVFPAMLTVIGFLIVQIVLGFFGIGIGG